MIFFQGFSLLIGFFGFILRGAPADPDRIFTVAQEWGVVLIFFWFFISLVSWGFFWESRLRLGHLGFMGAMAFGTGWFALAGFTLGHLGWIGYSYFSLIFIFIHAGVILTALQGAERVPVRLGFSPMALGAVEKIGLISVFAIFLGCILKAAMAHGTTDPYLYHLLGPRIWADNGQINLPSYIPIVYQSSWWEMLILLSQSLLGASGGMGLIEGQLFGQYLHVVLGMGGCLLVLYYFISHIPGCLAWIGAILLLSLGSRELILNASLAKNDWGVMFWALMGACLLILPTFHRLREIAAAGLFLGLAVMGKPNTGFFALTLILVWWWIGLRRALSKEVLIQVGVLLAGMLITMLPILIRNGVSTGNPLFPFLGSLTRQDLLTPVVLRTMPTEPILWHFSSDYALKQVRWILKDSPIHICLFLAPIFYFLFKNRLQKVLCALAFFSVLWLLSVEIPNPFVRWAGVSLLLSGVIGGLFIAEIFSKLSFFWGQKKWISWLQTIIQIISPLYLALVFMPPGPLGILTSPSPSLVIRNPRIHWGGDSKAWLRMNADFFTPIFTTGDNQLYYISSLAVAPFQDDPWVGREVDLMYSADDLVDHLRELGFRYVLDVDHWMQRFWSYQGALLDHAAFLHPESIVFEGPNSEVIDLKTLQESMKFACAKSGEYELNLNKIFGKI